MPAYEVEHVVPLSEDQKDQLAEAITRIHSTQFNAPRLFVNVRITDTSKHQTYVAGKRVSGHTSPFPPSSRHIAYEYLRVDSIKPTGYLALSVTDLLVQRKTMMP